MLKIYTELSTIDRNKYKEKAAEVYCHLGDEYNNVKKYKEAEQMYKEALERYIELSSENKEFGNEKIETIYTTLAHIYGETKQHHKSLKIYKKLISINSFKYIGKIADELYFLGTLYYCKKKYELAEKKYQKALEIYKQMSATNYSKRLDMANICNCLCNIYQKTDRKEAEEKTYTEMREILKNFNEIKQESHDRYTLEVWDRMSQEERKWYKETEEAYKNGLEIYIELGEDGLDQYMNPLVALNKGLGDLYKATNRYEKAQIHYEQTLFFYKRLNEIKQDFDMENMAAVFHNLGIVCYSRDQYKKAEEEYTKALELYRSINENIQSTDLIIKMINEYNNLYILYIELNHTKKAEDVKKEVGKLEDIILNQLE